MTISVRYFAVLRERSGLERELVETLATSPEELYAELVDRHALGLPLHLVRFAVDGGLVDANVSLTDGSEVALIPPVAGG